MRSTTSSVQFTAVPGFTRSPRKRRAREITGGLLRRCPPRRTNPATPGTAEGRLTVPLTVPGPRHAPHQLSRGPVSEEARIVDRLPVHLDAELQHPSPHPAHLGVGMLLAQPCRRPGGYRGLDGSYGAVPYRDFSGHRLSSLARGSRSSGRPGPAAPVRRGPGRQGVGPAPHTKPPPARWARRGLVESGPWRPLEGSQPARPVARDASGSAAASPQPHSL